MIKTNNASPIINIDRRGLRKLAGQVWRDYANASCDLSITFVSRQQIIEINQNYLQRSYATDVIAFNLGESPDSTILADVYICPEVAAENAKDLGFEQDDELARLVVHGVLHVLGFDDATTEQRAEMRRHEDRYLQNYLKERHNGKK